MKEFTIKVQFGDFHDTTSDSNQIGPDRWRVRLNARDKRHGADARDLVPIVCHELGHVIGQELLGEIENQEDYMGKTFGIVTPNALKEEERAWDIGQNIFDGVKTYALGTYKKSNRMARRFYGQQI